jgi:WD repeat and SOF domain-containing protein 1
LNLIPPAVCRSANRNRSCATDKTIKLFDPYNTPSGSAPLNTWMGTTAFNGLSHHRSKNTIAAASSLNVCLYDLERQGAAPEILQWPNSTDTVTNVAFNQVESSVLASCATDRSIVLFDLRTNMPLAKTVLKFACNSLSWNPVSVPFQISALWY